MHFAVLFVAITTPYWMKEPWWNDTLSVLPNVLGFALGGYAIWLGFGDDAFRDLISQRDEGDSTSPYMEVSASFAHFIVVQALALLFALFVKAMQSALPLYGPLSWLRDTVGLPADFYLTYVVPVGNAVGFLLFVYALTLAVAATLAIFRVATWFERHRNQRNDKNERT